MDIGDGVTVNSSNVNRTKHDNGQTKSSNESSGLPSQTHSPTGSVNKVRMTSDLHSSAGSSSRGSGSSSAFENKENIPSNETSDAILSTSSKENLGAMLKSAMETLDSDNGFQEQPIYATSDLHPRETISSSIEESTEVIGNSPSYNENHFGKERKSPSTDSDIEILSAEEIAASGSSTKCIVTPMNPLQICSTEKEVDQKQAEESKPKKEDLEIIVVDRIFGPLTANDIPFLLKVIGDQLIKIKKLESTRDRFRERHKTLFEHVEGLRLALDMKDIDTIEPDVDPIDKL
uniref:Uncharacterized protein n=1 Tax=Ceratitis capitata TaxID=7213 RepID=W8BX28_CERCA